MAPRYRRRRRGQPELAGYAAGEAPELKKNGKRMILLWMDGGPSQYDTFNPKPGSEFQGPAQAINTAIPGVQIG